MATVLSAPEGAEAPAERRWEAPERRWEAPGADVVVASFAELARLAGVGPGSQKK
jgi:hypothetical protein